MEGNQFKACPFCKEQIRDSAIKCRFCGEWLEIGHQRKSEGDPNPHDKRLADTISNATDVPNGTNKSGKDQIGVEEPGQVNTSDALLPVVQSKNTLEKERWSKTPKVLKWGTAALFAFSVFKLLLVGADLTPTGNQKLGGLLARILFCAAIIAWFSRKGGKSGALFAFSLTCALGVILSTYIVKSGEARQRSQETARRVATNLMEWVQEASTGGVPLVKPMGTADLDASVQPLNDFAKSFFKYLNRMEEEIGVLGAQGVYLTSVLNSKAAIEAEMQKRSQSLKIIQKYQSGFPALVDTARNSFASNSTSDEMRQSALLGFEEAAKSGTPQVEEMFSLRLQRERAEFAFLEFMLEAFDDYEVKEESISFRTSSSMEKYRVFTKGIQDAAAEAEAFQKRQAKTVDAVKSKIKKLAD
jgi:hypothetical protein